MFSCFFCSYIVFFFEFWLKNVVFLGFKVVEDVVGSSVGVIYGYKLSVVLFFKGCINKFGDMVECFYLVVMIVCEDGVGYFFEFIFV